MCRVQSEGDSFSRKLTAPFGVTLDESIKVIHFIDFAVHRVSYRHYLKSMGQCCAKAVESNRAERDINMISENPSDIECARYRRMMMLALPVDVLCGGILPYLSVCDLQALDTAFTNKYLRPQLQQVWKSYQYDSLDVDLKEYEVFWLCRQGVRIISFTVESDVSESDFILMNTSTVKRLRHTSRVGCNVIWTIASNCPNLEELSLEYVYGRDSDNAVSALAQNCRQLHTLHIGSGELTDAGILALSQCCGQLSNISICHAKVTYVGIQLLCNNCPHLKHIGFSYCYNLTDASLIAIANGYPQLQSIHHFANRFTDDGLIYFASKCHELRSVSKCNIITSRGHTALWAANPNLMDVDISKNNFVSDNVIIQLVQCCPQLQKLNISICDEITDAAVIAVAEHCPQLRSFNIYRCYKMSDASLIALGQHCHELISIDISCLLKISDVGIAALAAGCPLLQELHADSTKITDGGVVALARICRDLRIIHFYYCLSISVAAVSAIAENCPLLSELWMYSCKVGDSCLYVIAQHCRNLTVLDMWCTEVSDVPSVISVIELCRMLRVIDCRNCFRHEEDKVAIRKYAGCRVKVYV